ncbi:G2/mitotic-specific cyclin S13-7-like [Iris pallida]|uniref:G2/mitotic-specific cyclin S13-7-like n=1 Tax=Iris pallida TaxID=29817 RepID=A0AAX6IJ30_IRIPA|nr:G2/mitotic-specific cyclin S13-7-like [Iris pallida]
MATRHQVVVPQQQKGGVVAPKAKPKTAADGGPDGKNRRALGDIGNLVTARGAAAVAAEGKPQVCRPITRSFGAQLLANAQAAAAAAAAAGKVQKPVAVAADGAARKGPAKEAKPTKVTIKDKPEVVIVEISPDSSAATDTATKKQQQKKKASSRKKVSTLTSVLTARSKAACGVVDETKLPVPDIDAADAEDQLAVADYVEDLYKFYKLSEGSSRPRDYIGSQAEINAKMRAILADWLIEVHSKFELMPESLYLTFHVIDRYLSAEGVAVPRRELQLVGVGAMLIACKYEEIWAPEVADFVAISDRAYSREQILATEKAILNKLEWSLTVPTPYVFLVRFIKASSVCCDDKEMEHMVFFLAELGLMQYSVVVAHTPSMIAASAVYVARCTLKKDPLWTSALRCHTGLAEPQLLDCAELLVRAHAAAPTDKLRFVYKKYSSSQLGGVALRPPATELMEQLKKKAAAGAAIKA